MSVDVTGKHWLLQNERALQALAAHPERTVGSISAVFAVKREELQAWLDKYNGGKSDLTSARIHAVKTELGLLSVERAPAAGAEKSGRKAEPAAPAPPAEKPRTWAGMRQEQREARAEKSPAVTTQDDGLFPWAKRVRGPQGATVKKYRSQLDRLAAGGSVDDNGPAWIFFLNAWLGSRFPAATRVRRFLAWYDGGRSAPIPQLAAKAVPPTAAKSAPEHETAPDIAPTKSAPESEPPPALSDEWVELRCERIASSDDAYYNAKGHNPVIVFRRPVMARLAQLGIKAGSTVTLSWNPRRGLLGIARRANGPVKLRAEHGMLCVKRKDLFRVLGAKALSFQFAVKLPGDLPPLDLVLEVKGGAT